MNPTASQSVIDLLLASGVPSREEALQLAQNMNGGSWTAHVLDSGKVDEQRFLSVIGNFFRVPVISIDPKTVERDTLSILPSRFVFQHHILPIEVKETSVVLATYDLFNSLGRQLAGQLLKKPAEWVLVPRPQLLRAMKTLYGVGAETFDEILKSKRDFEILQESNQEIDVRVSTIPTVNGESISLRLLARGGQQFGFQRLDMSKKQEKTIRHLLAQPNGIILLTGPTGCGKSTSLYCFLSTINSVQRRIITIEEPVEYKLPGVLQMDVKPEIDFTFARGLRHILRQDPNVVMVGEIRDVETADIAIRAAMTGHLVFSTLHTNDAVGGITRLLDMDVEPFLLASVVKSFIAQRLVRTVCPECAEKVEYPSEYLAEIGFPLKELGARFTRGKGCEQCRHTGYQGRAAIYEICVVTEPLRKLIMQKKDGGELKQCAIAEGMETLRQEGCGRVAQGNTTIEEVVRVTQTDEVMAETTEDAEPVGKR